MEAMGLTWFDTLALGVIVLSAIMGLARGLIREVFSIVGFVVALVAGYFFAGQAAPIASSLMGVDGIWAMLAGGFGVFLVVFIAITILTMIIARSAHRSTEIGSFDRAAGLAYGVVRGILIIALFIALITPSQTAATEPGAAAPAQRGFVLPEDITGARLFPMFDAVAGVLRSVLPQWIDRSEEFLQEHRPTAPGPASPASTDAAPAQTPAPAATPSTAPAPAPANN
jgi:membrane protein required for colicin V production